MLSPSLRLCFFWHMHQPDYRDATGRITMPWVFLHAIKDYYDMPWLVSRYEGVKASFNITSPLIEQLGMYEEALKNDYFLSLWIKHPSVLEPAERSWMIKLCNSVQFETMARPLGRFSELYGREAYNDNELIELEILFLLSWCGNYLRQNDLTVIQMIERGFGYVQEDKVVLLEALSKFVGTVLPFYRSLLQTGKISLSTTPYNHPILPLLFDMENALRANPFTVIPENPISLAEDAKEQVDRAIELFEQTFGRKPTGLWPAEGAVDEKSIALYVQRGIQWIATDEAILLKSLETTDRSVIYRPYRLKEMTMGFRDHYVSDLIGFEYRHMDASDAARHFADTLAPIASATEEKTIFVIVDGENAWEYYRNNGLDFFEGIYRFLSESEWCKTVTMDEVARSKEHGVLSKIAPGSWIHGTFDTWAGHPEKNRAWELIYQTHRSVEEHFSKFSLQTRERIREHMLAAECSDWFWWYGDDHSTSFAEEFDALFRNHLISVYHLLKIGVPTELFDPIISSEGKKTASHKPFGPISPHLGTYRFLEWFGSGIVTDAGAYSTMDRVRGPIALIRYGADENNFYAGFQGDFSLAQTAMWTLKITIEEEADTLRYLLNGSEQGSVVFWIEEGWMMMKLGREVLGMRPSVHLNFELCEGEKILQKLPYSGPLKIDFDRITDTPWFV